MQTTNCWDLLKICEIRLKTLKELDIYALVCVQVYRLCCCWFSFRCLYLLIDVNSLNLDLDFSGSQTGGVLLSWHFKGL